MILSNRINDTNAAPWVIEEIRKLEAERDALAAELARYNMSAGHADQRRAESRAVRKALGFEPDAEDVSPRDLLDALARLKAQWQAEALEAMASHLWPVGIIGKGCERNALLVRAEELRRQAKENTQ